MGLSIAGSLTLGRPNPGLSAVPSAWDGASVPYSPSVSLSWAAPPAGTLTTRLFNKTTGNLVYFGPPTTTLAADPSPAPGVTNSYELTHAGPVPAVGVSGTNFTAGGVTAGRAGGMDVYGLALMSTRGVSARGTPGQSLYVPTAWQQDAMIAECMSIGARWIRIYGATSYASSDSLYPTMGGALNEAVAVGLDRAVALCRHYGIICVLTLLDNKSYGYWKGGGDVFGGWGAAGGAANFYTDATALANFTALLNLLLERVNTYTGLRYKNSANVVWQLTNEEDGGPSWTSSVVGVVHAKNPNAVVIAGTTPVPNAQGDDRHTGGVTAANVPGVVAQANATTPLIFGEMYGWNFSGQHSGLLADNFTNICSAVAAQSRIRVAAVWTACMKGDAPGTNTSENGVGGGRAAGQGWYANVAPALTEVELEMDLTRTDKPNQDDFVSLCATMNGEANPAPRLDPPLAFLTGYDVSAGAPKVGWRGSPGSRGYVIQRSTTGPNATDFADVATALKETDSPWADPSPPSAARWYRVVPLSAQPNTRGTPGNAVGVF